MLPYLSSFIRQSFNHSFFSFRYFFLSFMFLFFLFYFLPLLFLFIPLPTVLLLHNLFSAFFLVNDHLLIPVLLLILAFITDNIQYASQWKLFKYVCNQFWPCRLFSSLDLNEFLWLQKNNNTIASISYRFPNILQETTLLFQTNIMWVKNAYVYNLYKQSPFQSSFWQLFLTIFSHQIYDIFLFLWHRHSGRGLIWPSTTSYLFLLQIISDPSFLFCHSSAIYSQNLVK